MTDLETELVTMVEAFEDLHGKPPTKIFLSAPVFFSLLRDGKFQGDTWCGIRLYRAYPWHGSSNETIIEVA